MLVCLPVLLCGSAFFSGGETAIFSLSRHQRHQLNRSDGFASRLTVQLLDERRQFLVTLLMGNMFVNILYFVISTVLILSLHKRGTLSAAAGNTLNVAALLLLILTGEVMPKLIASGFPKGWALTAAMPLMVVHRVLAPLRIVTRATIIVPLSRLVSPASHPIELTIQELEKLLELSQHRGIIDAQEEQLLQQVLALSQMKVKDLMRPRVDILAHDLDDPADALLETARQVRVSRLPVYRKDLDHIEGVVYRREVFLKHPRTAADVEALVHPVRFVPELQRVDRLLVELRRRGATLAIAVDEYGGTAGLVTLEDVVESMLGQITDQPHASQTPPVEQLALGRWRVSGQLGIRDWVSLFGPDLRDVEGVSTIGDLVMAHLGRVAKAGDRMELRNLDIEVESVTGSRIEQLTLELRDPPSTTAENLGSGVAP